MVDQEAARDLVRVREDCRGDLMRAPPPVEQAIMRHGIIHDGAAWTGKHEPWLAGPHMTGAATQAAFDAEYEAVLQIKARREQLDRIFEALRLTVRRNQRAHQPARS